MTDKNLQIEDDKVEGQQAVEPSVEELKRQIAERDQKAKAAQETAEAERRAREAAEARARERDQEVEQLKTQAKTAEQQAVENAIGSATQESESAQRDLQIALENANYPDVAKAQARIATAAAKLLQLEQAKAAIDAHAVQALQQDRVDVSRPADPTESFLTKFSPRTQGWLRGHRELIVTTNGAPTLNPKVMSLHYAALGEGITPESDEYFAYIDQGLAPKKAQDEDDHEDAPPQRRAPVSAPVSRDPPGGNQRPSRVRLTAAEVEAARLSGISEADYAANKLALVAEGKLGRTTH